MESAPRANGAPEALFWVLAGYSSLEARGFDFYLPSLLAPGPALLGQIGFHSHVADEPRCRLEGRDLAESAQEGLGS